MEILIREAEHEDAERLDELLTLLIRDEGQYDDNLNEAYVVRDNYRERVRMDGHKLLVAEIEGKIVGYLYGFVYQIPGMFHRSVAILDALYVEESHRRLGCGRRLISEFCKFARENGACRVELKVLSENERAFSLYSGLGFLERKKYMDLTL